MGPHNSSPVEAIVAAAEQLVLAGTEPIGVDAIAHEAGVDLEAVHRLFPDERAIFAEVFRRKHLEYFDAVDGVLVAHDNLEEGIEQLVRILLDLPPDELEARRILNTRLPLSWTAGELRSALHIIQRRMVQWAIHMVDDVPEQEMKRRIYHCLGVVRGLAMMRFLDLDDAPPTEQVVESVRAILVRLVRHGAE